MKHIKEFENLESKFEVGEIAKFMTADIFDGEFGEIVEPCYDDLNKIKLYGYNILCIDNNIYLFRSGELEKASKEEIEEYILLKNAKKYNL